MSDQATKERSKILLMGSVGFYEAARSLYQETAELHWPAFIVILSYAAELSVKSFVIQNFPDADEKTLKFSIGHDISKGLTMAIEAGYVPPNHITAELFDILNKSHIDHTARYLNGDSVDLKPFDLMLAGMAHHIGTVGLQLGLPISLPRIREDSAQQ